MFLAGYNAYMQVTNVINDLSGPNDSPAMKNRQYRIPTYVSIVEGCLTNLYRFIALILNQTTDKDYAAKEDGQKIDFHYTENKGSHDIQSLY
ncbi:hypothetical protein EBB54_00060 [Schaedlerella arabinosiphila]|uniref:Uncharacterized protein n=1 Tax=Schaedlerella arabinosiphila TaxID=2044587 RepID=A0A426DS47_9FIRM|nr:hypothetical protein [Schaedlerella arabinosiphila]RRK36897.1 hypothetical protein EBB54_00060 [Schaedlerella arabinosiphila]